MASDGSRILRLSFFNERQDDTSHTVRRMYMFVERDEHRRRRTDESATAAQNCSYAPDDAPPHQYGAVSRRGALEQLWDLAELSFP